MKFNKDQKEGFCRVMDALAVAGIIGGVVGVTGHSPLNTLEILGLFLLSAILISTANYVRSTYK